MLARSLRAPLAKVGLRESEVGADVLAGDPAFATLPRMKTSRHQVLQRCLVTTEVVVKGRELRPEIVASVDEVAVGFHIGQPLRGGSAPALRQLVRLEQNSRIAGIGIARLAVGGLCVLAVAAPIASS
jgi:hypothetical protein